MTLCKWFKHELWISDFTTFTDEWKKSYHAISRREKVQRKLFFKVRLFKNVCRSSWQKGSSRRHKKGGKWGKHAVSGKKEWNLKSDGNLNKSWVSSLEETFFPLTFKVTQVLFSFCSSYLMTPSALEVVLPSLYLSDSSKTAFTVLVYLWIIMFTIMHE